MKGEEEEENFSVALFSVFCLSSRSSFSEASSRIAVVLLSYNSKSDLIRLDLRKKLVESLSSTLFPRGELGDFYLTKEQRS